MCSKVTDFVRPSTSSLRSNKVAAAELKLCVFIAEHNLPVSILDHLPGGYSLVAEVFPHFQVQFGARYREDRRLRHEPPSSDDEFQESDSSGEEFAMENLESTDSEGSTSEEISDNEEVIEAQANMQNTNQGRTATIPLSTWQEVTTK
ncbi:hypothetical protein FHG87_007693 [Trinorchestia longiramus]|nr:hypothetical protein FHG87_007693 [Trinorchestia longiramus]